MLKLLHLSFVVNYIIQRANSDTVDDEIVSIKLP